VIGKILIDAGPLIALFNSRDTYHKDVCDFLAKNSSLFLVSTLAVYTEVSHILKRNIKAQRDFYEWVMYRGIILCEINQHDMPRIYELTGKYADLPMDFADATLVVAAEKTGIRKIISLDKDFDIYRLPGREKIKNVFKG